MSEVNTTSEATNEVKGKLIFNAQLAKFLLEEKNLPIIGLKANRDNKDRSVFVFTDGLTLRDAMAEYNKIKRNRRRERPEDSVEEVKEPLLMED